MAPPVRQIVGNDDASKRLQPKPILENVSWLLGANALTKPAWFVFLFIAARVLGPKDFGEFQLFTSVAFFVTIIVDLGIDQALVREMALDVARAPRYLGSMGAVKLVLSAAAISVSLVLPFIFPKISSTSLLLLATIAQINAMLLSFVRSAFRAHERMELEARSTIMEKMLIAAAALTVVLLTADVRLVFAAIAVASTVALAYTVHLLRRVVMLRKLRADRSVIRPVLRQAFPFAAMGIFALINTRTDTLLMAIFKGNYEVGIYQASFRYIEFLIFLPGLMMTPLFPRLSRLLKDRREDSRRLVRSFFIWLIPGSLVLSLFMATASTQIILLILGDKYENSIAVFQALVWVFPAVSATFLFGTVLASAGKQSVGTIIAGIAAVANVALNFVLIPLLSYHGAVIAALTSNGAQAILTTWLGARELGRGTMNPLFLKLGLAIVFGVLAWAGATLVFAVPPYVGGMLSAGALIGSLIVSRFYVRRDIVELVSRATSALHAGST